MNPKFQNAIKGVAQNCPPVWFMRQAGRYHQHYQKLRKENSFMDLCKNPKLAAEVALGPIEDFDFDISILFSDLLFPLEVMGMGLDYQPGPVLEWHLTGAQDLKKLKTGPETVEQLMFQKEACQLTRKLLPENKSFIGFVGGPWTLFSYAVAGSHESKLKVKEQLPIFPSFCEILMPLLKQNIQLQLDGGVEAVMVLDTSAGDLDPHIYNNLIVPIIKDLSASFPKQLGYYTKNTNYDHIKDLMVDENLAGIGVDHRWDMAQVLDQSNGFVQGNFDQQLLFMDSSSFEKTMMTYLETMAKLSPEQRKGWVCGLGHGVLPKTPEAHVKLFVQRVREVFGE